VSVIWHQAGSKHRDFDALPDGRPKTAECSVVPIVMTDLRAVVATVDDVGTTSRADGPPASGHAGIVNGSAAEARGGNHARMSESTNTA
jgi:hypothetical protein